MSLEVSWYPSFKPYRLLATLGHQRKARLGLLVPVSPNIAVRKVC